ncbi:MAG: tryptophan synthase subunit alpha [Gemmataceae bacterium]|nr:tryptophan synthase subunit alpha [Gemmataceae bacterium]
MSAIATELAKLKAKKQLAFIPFITAGDPDLETTVSAITTLVDQGANLIEIGFPFSDPVADGPIIQASYTRALEKGIKILDIFTRVQELTSRPDFHTPLVGMVSYSLIFRYGVAEFTFAAKSAGFAGLIVPDLPPEEADELSQATQSAELDLILLVTPTTTLERAKKIASLSRGFLYCVSIVGITGTQSAQQQSLQQYLERIRTVTDLPLCVGFGISQPEHIQRLQGLAEGAIVGSSLVRCLHEKGIEGLKQQAQKLAQATLPTQG